MATPAVISDDWEEVDGDDFSVVSVPGSDDHSNAGKDSFQDCLLSVGTLTDNPVTEGSEHSTASGNNDCNEAQGAKTCDVNDVDGVDEVDEVERRGMDTKDVAEPEEAPLQPLHDFLDSDDVGPGSLGTINSSLIKLIEDIISFLDFKCSFEQSETQKIKSGCHALLVHLRSLSPVLEGYAKHFESGKDNRRGLPLDPGLESWLSNLTTEMLTLQKELQDSMDRKAYGILETRYLQDARRFEEAVEIFTAQMDALMPTIQDNEFLSLEGNDQASNKSEATLEVQQKRVQSDNDIWNLRQELYDLKDQVASCANELGVHQPQHAGLGSGENAGLLTGIAQSYRFIHTSLDVILSNHVSDWIDNSVSGGLTYAEFCRLSPDIIRTLHVQLKSLVKHVSDEMYSARTLRYMNDPDNILEQDATPSLNDTLLNELYSLEDTLISMFKLTKPAIYAPE
ncbi:hypothetical protein SLS62_000991 [Diatrype stigma]|uniref:Uncharacterized protein n=1 Tax=Diatrype stigma TaxID=117547 RepID=A0AAN9UWW0_9PEZI